MTYIIVQIDDAGLIKGIRVMSNNLYVLLVFFVRNYVWYVLLALI